ncbi:VWA domain-containing protein [Pseudacidobacterium ailaaui]|jgi:VWFA-related protein|uniref:VWA domain-containing protein n=1 Tax=Pseudacidobacterium ailaaui TaxID=1382359 RepID=UPI00047C73C7|nr:VWA domain-containing protein [Pseudacidobacterium ailaaui]MBX6361042.1 VWA domain-containing protein [Pseudacidobacterium ailaaui]MCL6463884.1 VWA domain-containing protein [Pseudacidobacterium ailaaui]MDI3255699.1 VWA domain-containing protein [Bacillota bacterium]
MKTVVFRNFALCALVAVSSVFLAVAQSAPATTQTQSPQPSTGTTQPQPSAPGGQQPQDQEYTITTSANEVNLVFTVTDKHGRFIKDLKLSDFALLDDQKAPAQVFSFTQQTNLPLRVGIVIDTSTSIRQRFQFEQQSASEFLLQILRPKSDKAFVMGFDVTPDYKQDWTNNLDLLNTGINALRPGGGTALFDAVYSACRDKMLDAAREREPVRRAMVLVSDGNDNQSHAYLDDAIKMCQRAQTIVYTISTNTSPSRDRGDDVLEKIALATGGRAFFPKRMEDMYSNFQDIEDELRSQYSLVYKPADFIANGAFRTIYLFCLDRRYTVRASKGYFATK